MTLGLLAIYVGILGLLCVLDWLRLDRLYDKVNELEKERRKPTAPGEGGK